MPIKKPDAITGSMNHHPVGVGVGGAGVDSLSYNGARKKYRDFKSDDERKGWWR